MLELIEKIFNEENRFLFVEGLAVASGLLYIYLQIKQRSSMWLVGFFSSLVYVFVFFNSKLFALSSIYVYYTAMSVYGLYCWRFSKKSNKGQRPVIRLNLKLAIILLIISAILTPTIGYILDRWLEASNNLPYIEGLVTALSIVGTWMLAKKIIEHWLVWIFVNFCSAVLAFYNENGLDLTAGLFVIYGILSIVGWIKWK